MSTHINAANKNDIAESILLPGDPLRAKFIAENFLDSPKCYNEIRGMLGIHRNLQRCTCFCTGNRHGDALHGDLLLGADH